MQICVLWASAWWSKQKGTGGCSPRQQQGCLKLWAFSHQLSLWLTLGLGFNIVGGTDQQYVSNDSSIYVSRIKKDGAAYLDGRLQEGDKIVAVSPSSCHPVRSWSAVFSDVIRDAGLPSECTENVMYAITWCWAMEELSWEFGESSEHQGDECLCSWAHLFCLPRSFSEVLLGAALAFLRDLPPWGFRIHQAFSCSQWIIIYPHVNTGVDLPPPSFPFLTVSQWLLILLLRRIFRP